MLPAVGTGRWDLGLSSLLEPLGCGYVSPPGPLCDPGHTELPPIGGVSDLIKLDGLMSTTSVEAAGEGEHFRVNFLGPSPFQGCVVFPTGNTVLPAQTVTTPVPVTQWQALFWAPLQPHPCE